MEDKILYSEQRKSIGLTIILGFFTVLMAGYLTVHLIAGPLGARPAPIVVQAALSVFFLLMTINFRKLTITITESGVKVYYGVFGTTRQWKDIAACERDEVNAVYGWGIRFGMYKKQWVWVYNVIGGPRVVFVAKSKKPRGLIISTANPDEVIAAASKQIGK